MKRFFRTHLPIGFLLGLLLMGLQAGNVGQRHASAVACAPARPAPRLTKKAPFKVESLSRSTWGTSPVVTEDESPDAVTHSLVRYVSNWLGKLLRPRDRVVGTRVDAPRPNDLLIS